MTDTRSDDSENRFVPVVFNEIDRLHEKEGSLYVLELHVKLFVEKKAVSRRCAPALRISLEIGPSLNLGDRVEPDDLTGVGDPRDRPEQHGNLEFFRHLKSDRHHVLGIFRACRVKNRDFCEHGHEPSVLLSLGGVGTRIIRADDHEPSDRPDIG